MFHAGSFIIKLIFSRLRTYKSYLKRAEKSTLCVRVNFIETGLIGKSVFDLFWALYINNIEEIRKT